MHSLSRPARLYLIHLTLLTLGLAVTSLFFNLAIVALGYDRLMLPVPLLGSLSLLGVLNSLTMLTAALSSLPIWWLVNLIGLRPALLIATTLESLALLCVALWPEPWLLLLVSALLGPVSVLFQVSSAPFLMRHSSEDSRDTLFSLNGAIAIGVAGLGSLLAGPLPGLASRMFGLATQSAAAYRATYVVAAAVVGLAILPLLLISDRQTQLASRPESAAAAQPALAELLRLLLNRPWATLRFLISPLLISCGAALLIPYLNLYFRRRFGVSDELLGLIFAAVGMGTGAATLIAPKISARLGKMGSVVLTQSLAIPCLLLLGAAPVLWLAVLAALLRGALMNMAIPLYHAHAMEQSPELARPAIIGLISAAFSAGYIIGPTVSAQIQLAYGFAPIFAATAACYTLGAASNYLIFVRPWRLQPVE